jgi:SAM-dependent methyltransferase
VCFSAVLAEAPSLTRASYEPSEPLHQWLAKRILISFTRTGNISPRDIQLLEVGTGTRRIGIQTKKLGFLTYTGIEPTKELAEYSRTKHDLNILEQALPDLDPSLTETFGAVISLHVLEHTPTYLAAREWIAEMARVLQKDGLLLIAAPDIHDYKTYFWDTD